MATSLVGTVAANRGQTKKEYVDYVFDAVLANELFEEFEAKMIIKGDADTDREFGIRLGVRTCE